MSNRKEPGQQGAAEGKLRIMHIITRLDKGGSADVALRLAEGLQRRGHDVHLITGVTVDPQEPLDEYARISGVEVSRVPCLVREASPLDDVCALFYLVRLIRERRPDIVHTHTSKAGILGRLAARIVGHRAVVHSPHGHIFYGYFGPRTTQVFIDMERLAARWARRITTLTERGKRDHVRTRIAPSKKFVTIHCGIPVKEFAAAGAARAAARRDLGYSSHDLVVGWVGRLVDIKGCGDFIRASALVGREVPSARFLVAGEGPESGALRTLAAQLGVADRVRFLGQRTDVPRIMAALDAFVLSSINEGLGRVLVEAMAAGVPVVATSVGGVPEVVIDGQTGRLVSPRNPRAIANAVTQLLRNKSERKRLARNGRQHAERFDLDIMVERFAALYAEVLSSKEDAA